MVKISDNKLDLKEISKALCGVDISIVEENYFITVFKINSTDINLEFSIGTEVSY